MGISNKFTKEASPLNRTGKLLGFVMGRAVSEVGAALEFFSSVATGKPNLSLGAQATKIEVKQGPRHVTVPRQLDGRELADTEKQSKLSALSAFKEAAKGGYKKGRAAPTITPKRGMEFKPT